MWDYCWKDETNVGLLLEIWQWQMAQVVIDGNLEKRQVENIQNTEETR